VKSLTLTVFCLLSTGALAQTKPAVVFIATGGTIAMKIDPVKHAPVPAISGEDLLATVPEVSKYATVESIRGLQIDRAQVRDPQICYSA
jgi:L-asparaginase